MVLNRTTAMGSTRSPTATSRTNATICDTRLRTANSQAECGSPDDFYF